MNHKVVFLLLFFFVSDVVIILYQSVSHTPLDVKQIYMRIGILEKGMMNILFNKFSHICYWEKKNSSVRKHVNQLFFLSGFVKTKKKYAQKSNIACMAAIVILSLIRPPLQRITTYCKVSIILYRDVENMTSLQYLLRSK